MDNIEDNFDDVAHNNLLQELKKLSGQSKKVRRERTVRVPSDAKPSFKLGNVLSKIGDQNLSVASRDLKSLPKPLEKPEAKRLKRAAGFEELAVDVNRWEGVVEQRRKSGQLSFPLKKADVRIITTERNYKPPMKTELEKEIYKLMDGAQLEEKDEETKEDKEIRKAMTLEEIRLKSKEDWRARILRHRLMKKASMLNKSKSRKYRQILRRDRLRSQKEEFERLKTSDPEAALEALKEIEQTRLTERMTLRHKKSKWLSGQGTRAARDFVARDMLKENTDLRKELLKKLKTPEEEDEEISDDPESKSDAEEEKISDKENVEEDDDFSSFRKTWMEFYQKKSEENKGRESLGGKEVAERGSKQVKDRKSAEEAGNVPKDGRFCEIENNVDVNCNVVKDDSCNGESSMEDSGLWDEEQENGDLVEINGVERTKVGKESDVKKSESSGSCESMVDVRKGKIKKDKLRKIKDGRVGKVKRDKINKKVNVLNDKSDTSKMKTLRRLKEKAISDGDLVNVKKLKDIRGKVITTDRKSSWVITVMKKDESQIERKSDTLKENDKVTKKVKGGKTKKGKDNGSDDVMVESGRDVWKVNDLAESGIFNRKVNDLAEGGIVNKKVNDTAEGGISNERVNDLADDLFIDDLFHKGEEKVIKKVGEKLIEVENDLNERKSRNKKGRKSSDSGEDKGDKVIKNMEMEFDFKTKDAESNLDERLTSTKTLDPQQSLGLNNHRLSDEVANSVEGVNKATKILEKDTQACKPDSSKSLVSLDHNEVVLTKSRKMGSSRPDYSYLKRKLEEGTDSDGEGEAELQNIFDEEDMTENIREFKAAKKSAEEEAQPKDINLFQQGWGSWTGPGIAKKKNKTKKFRIKAPKAQPNKYSRIGHVIYNEKSDVHENIRKNMVSDLPYPFASVADFEASIRQSTSRKFIPETAHKKLIAPPIITKMGTVIPPMDEEALLSWNKKSRGPSKLEERLTERLKGRKRSQKTSRKSHKKNKVKSLVLED